MQLIHESITQCSRLGGALCPGLQLLLHALANPDPAALLGVAMTIFNAYPILIKPDNTNFIVSVEFVDRGASTVDRGGLQAAAKAAGTMNGGKRWH